MKKLKILLLAAFACYMFNAKAQTDQVGISPWGPEDELGSLNQMTDSTRLKALSSIGSGRVYDLGFDYFVGMPSFHSLGDPGYQYWLTHTPRGTVVDNPNGLGESMNQLVSYTGDAISMYTHMGTHIDALNHFGLNGKIWNGFSADHYLGDKGWQRAGAETIPPIVARGILIDVAASKGVDRLKENYRITSDDLKKALQRQGTRISPGDVVLIRTGQGNLYRDKESYLNEYAGISLEAVKWLVEEKGIMLLGADNLSFEAFPPERPDNWVPVHTYLLAEQGVMFMELVNLEALGADKVYEFAFIGASLKLRGASGSPMRPLAIPLRQSDLR